MAQTLKEMLAQIASYSNAANAGLMGGGWSPEGARGVNYNAVWGSGAPASKSGESRSGEGGGFATGESGSRSLQPIGSNSGNWMPRWMQPQQPGTMAGLNAARYGKWIGRGAGMLLPVPGGGLMGGLAGRALGNEYINSHYFQNDWQGDGPDPGPVDRPDALGPITFEDEARESSSPADTSLARGSGFSDGSRNPIFDQSRNPQAGMGSDFRTVFNWAHGG